MARDTRARDTRAQVPRQKSRGNGRGVDAGDAVNAIELLRRDHERVKQLFGRFARTEAKERRALAEDIFADLDLHAKLEEYVFYPAFAGIGQEEADAVAVSMQEHRVMKDFIRDLRSMEISDERYQERFDALREHVLDHAMEEEESVFPTAQLYLDLDGLGEQMQIMKSGGWLMHPIRAAASWFSTGQGDRWSSAVQDMGGIIRRNPAATLLIVASLLLLLSPRLFGGNFGRNFGWSGRER